MDHSNPTWNAVRLQDRIRAMNETLDQVDGGILVEKRSDDTTRPEEEEEDEAFTTPSSKRSIVDIWRKREESVKKLSHSNTNSTTSNTTTVTTSAHKKRSEQQEEKKENEVVPVVSAVKEPRNHVVSTATKKWTPPVPVARKTNIVRTPSPSRTNGDDDDDAADLTILPPSSTPSSSQHKRTNKVAQIWEKINNASNNNNNFEEEVTNTSSSSPIVESTPPQPATKRKSVVDIWNNRVAPSSSSGTPNNTLPSTAASSPGMISPIPPASPSVDEESLGSTSERPTNQRWRPPVKSSLSPTQFSQLAPSTRKDSVVPNPKSTLEQSPEPTARLTPPPPKSVSPLPPTWKTQRTSPAPTASSLQNAVQLKSVPNSQEQVEERKSPAFEPTNSFREKLKQTAGNARPIYSLPPPRLNRGNPSPPPPPLTDVHKTKSEDSSRETATMVEEHSNSSSSSFSRLADRWNKVTGSSQPPAQNPSWRRTMSPVTTIQTLPSASDTESELKDSQKSTLAPKDDTSPPKSTANSTSTNTGKVTDRWRFSWTATDNTDTMSDVVSSFGKSKWNQNVAALVNSHVNRIAAAHGRNDITKPSSFSEEMSKVLKTDTIQRPETKEEAATQDEDLIPNHTSLDDAQSSRSEKVESSANTRRKSTSSVSSLSPVVVPSDASSLIKNFASQTPVAKRRNKVLDRWFAADNAVSENVDVKEQNAYSTRDADKDSAVAVERSQPTSLPSEFAVTMSAKTTGREKNQDVNNSPDTNIAVESKVLSKLVREHSNHTPYGMKRKPGISNSSGENAEIATILMSENTAASEDINAAQDENDFPKSSENRKVSRQSDSPPTETSPSTSEQLGTPTLVKASSERQIRTTFPNSNSHSSSSKHAQSTPASERQNANTSPQSGPLSKADNKNENDLFTLTSPLNIIQAWSDKKLAENASDVMSDTGRSFLPTPKVKNTRSDTGTVSARSEEFTSPFKIIDAWSKKSIHPPTKRKPADIPKIPNGSEEPKSRTSVATSVAEDTFHSASIDSAALGSVKFEPSNGQAPDAGSGDIGKEDFLRMKRKNFMMLGRKHIVSRMPPKVDGAKEKAESESTATTNNHVNKIEAASGYSNELVAKSGRAGANDVLAQRNNSSYNDTKDLLSSRSALLPSPLKRWSKTSPSAEEIKYASNPTSLSQSSHSTDKNASHMNAKSPLAAHRSYRSIASANRVAASTQSNSSSVANNHSRNNDKYDAMGSERNTKALLTHTHSVYEKKRPAMHHEHFRDLQEYRNRNSSLEKVSTTTRTSFNLSNEQNIAEDPTVAGLSFADSSRSSQIDNEPEPDVSPRHLRDDSGPQDITDESISLKDRKEAETSKLNPELISAASEGVTSAADASGLSILSDADSEVAGIHESSSNVSSPSFAERAERVIKERRRKQKESSQHGQVAHGITNYNKKEMKVLDQFVKAATPVKDQVKLETEVDDLDDSLLAEDDIKPLLNKRYKTVSKLIEDFPLDCVYPEKKTTNAEKNRANDGGPSSSGVSADSALTREESKSSKMGSSNSKTSDRRRQRHSNLSAESNDLQQKNDPCGPRGTCKPAAVREMTADWVPTMSFDIHKLASAMDEKVNALRDFAGDFVGNGNSHFNNRPSLPIARSLKLPKCDGLSEVEDVAIEVEYVEDEEDVDYDSDYDNPEEDLGLCTRPLDGALRCTGVEKCDEVPAPYSGSTEESSSILEMERIGRRSSYPYR